MPDLCLLVSEGDVNVGVRHVPAAVGQRPRVLRRVEGEVVARRTLAHRDQTAPLPRRVRGVRLPRLSQMCGSTIPHGV
jgi:hypothetical protein